MAGGSKDTRSQRQSHELVGDLLRRATSPEVLAGVAGAVAAARFTKQAVEHAGDEEPEAQPEPEETDEANAAADHESDESEDEPESGEEEPNEDEPHDETDRDDVDPDGADDEPSGTNGNTSDDQAEDELRTGAEVEPDDGDEEEAADNGSSGSDADRLRLLSLARLYAEQLTGHPVESFSGLTQEDQGWRVGIEVVELSRVPSTTDVLGSYDLILTDEGEFVDFRRAQRYFRNSTDDAS